MQITPGQSGLTPTRGWSGRTWRPLLTAVVGWLLVFAAFNQFQPTLLVTLQSFLSPNDSDTVQEDDRDGDEVTVAVSSAGRLHRRRDCPVPPDVELPRGTAREVFCSAASPQASRAGVAHVPDCRNGIGAHLRC